MNTSPQSVEPRELCTRFLYLFNFRRNAISAARGALLALTVPDRNGVQRQVWQSYCLEDAPPAPDSEHPRHPHHLYKEELLTNVLNFVFNRERQPESSGSNGREGVGCSYLRLTDQFVSRWFNKLEVTLPGRPNVPVRLESPAQVELFLSSFGTGILSFALTPKITEIDRATALAFNYRLSQLRRATEAQLSVAGLPAHIAASLPPSESKDEALTPAAAIAERFGRPGAPVTLRPLIEEELLLPLAQYDLKRAQDQLSVYTVVRFGPEVDFESKELRADLAPFLSALAQVEEPTHAGAASDLPGIPNVLLNRRHWAAVGTIGAAHLIADQAPIDHPFNSARVPRLLLKYFIPYQAALFQRMALRGVTQEACQLVTSGEDEGGALSTLRGELLRFAVNGHFTEVSNRAAIQRYYRLCQEGLGVRDFLDDARRALSEMEAKQATDTQLKLAAATKQQQEQATKHLGVMRQLQVKVEWIEVFIIGFYSSELAHTFLSYWEAKQPQQSEQLPLLPPLVSFGIVAGVGVLCTIIALVTLRPWTHAGRE
jgi:hypothetical protein